MKTDAQIFREALEKLMPAAVYGANVADRIKEPGFTSMKAAVAEARRALRLGQKQ